MATMRRGRRYFYTTPLMAGRSTPRQSSKQTASSRDNRHALPNTASAAPVPTSTATPPQLKQTTANDAREGRVLNATQATQQRRPSSNNHTATATTTATNTTTTTAASVAAVSTVSATSASPTRSASSSVDVREMDRRLNDLLARRPVATPVAAYLPPTVLAQHFKREFLDNSLRRLQSTNNPEAKALHDRFRKLDQVMEKRAATSSSSSTAASSISPSPSLPVKVIHAIAVERALKAHAATAGPSPDSTTIRKKIKSNVYPLRHTWTLTFENRENINHSKKAESGEKYESHLQWLSTFDTVKDFWNCSNYTLPASKLSPNISYHLFKDGIKPMWEDKANHKGGKWQIVFTNKHDPETISQRWMHLTCALIGETLDPKNVVCGAVFQRKTKGDRISVWTRGGASNEDLFDVGVRLLSTLRLQDDSNVSVDFGSHYDTKNSSEYVTSDGRRLTHEGVRRAIQQAEKGEMVGSGQRR